MLPVSTLSPSHRPRILAAHFGLAAALLAAPPAGAGAISGVCPDGSIFIVQQVEAIPCRGAKRVDPGDIPPLNPEFLPRPYGWEVFNRETDPHNPYNLVDVPRGGPAPGVAAPPQAPVAPMAPQPPIVPHPIAAAPPPIAPGVAAAATGAPPLALGLSPREIDDLAAIVEVMQQRAPATFVERNGAAASQLRFARSAAFEARVARALAERGTPAQGPIVAFHLVAGAPTRFWGNLTFVQGHVAHHPDPADPAQFGVVDGRLGELAAGERVLGYAVLPPHADLARPLDLYWDDRLLTATLTP